MLLSVCETFLSLLGESTRAGLPAFFIRLTGCNLRCRWCDTAYAYEGGELRSVEDLLAAASSHSPRLVLVTGGEPLLQEGALPLLAGLADDGFEVLLETNGSVPIRAVDRRVRRIVDVKCPASGMADRMDWRNLEWLDSSDEVKFVVADENDFAYALAVIRDHRLSERLPVLISPVFGLVPLKDAAAWIVISGLPLRLNVQLHKYIWGPEVRGV